MTDLSQSDLSRVAYRNEINRINRSTEADLSRVLDRPMVIPAWMEGPHHFDLKPGAVYYIRPGALWFWL